MALVDNIDTSASMLNDPYCIGAPVCPGSGIDAITPVYPPEYVDVVNNCSFAIAIIAVGVVSVDGISVSGPTIFPTDTGSGSHSLSAAT